MQQLLQFAREVKLYAINPRFAGIRYLGAIQEKLEYIVMGIDNPEVLLQVLFRKREGTAHIKVAVQSAPMRTDKAEAIATPGGTSHLPTGTGVESGLLPAVALYVAGIQTFPRLLVGHRYQRLEHGAVGAHPTILLSVNGQEAVQRLLVVGPMACGTIGQLVIRRPDREIGVRDEQGHRRCTQVCHLIRRKQIIR